MATNLWIPQHLRGARKPVSVVFYYSKKLDRIEVGFPEKYPVPPVMAQMGFEKIVCNTAHDVERWSQKKRDQDKREQEMTDYEREMQEGPIRDAIRKDLLYKLSVARNQVNRDFLRHAIDKLDERERKGKVVIESYMHCEAAEDGK